jgi:hypothetical protein
MHHMNYQIKTSLDWSDVRSELMKQGKKLPMFYFEFKNFCNSIDEDVKKLSSLEVNLRRESKSSTKKRHGEMVSDINKRIGTFMKHFTMALLRYG